MHYVWLIFGSAFIMRSSDAFVIIPTLTTSGLRKKFAFFSTTVPDLSGLGMQTDPLFPGSVPITDDDKVTCERQTGQQAPSNALLSYRPLTVSCTNDKMAVEFDRTSDSFPGLILAENDLDFDLKKEEVIAVNQQLRNNAGILSRQLCYHVVLLVLISNTGY